MTRFFITLDQGVKFVQKCFELMKGGEIFIPKIPSMKIIDLAHTINNKMGIKEIGIRPGEKIHESLISAEEMLRAWKIDDFTYVINSVLPELVSVQPESLPIVEYSSKDDNISAEELYKLLDSKKLLSIKTFSNSEILA